MVDDPRMLLLMVAAEAVLIPMPVLMSKSLI